VTLNAYERAAAIEVQLFRDPSNPTPDGLGIDCRFVFRQSSVHASPARTLALETFEDFWEGLEFFDSQPALEEAQRRTPVTVVAASTAVLAEAHDGVASVTEPDVERLFDKTLRQLNELLTMLGYCHQNPEFGSVRRTELPSHIPVVLDIDLASGVPRRVELATLQIHKFEGRDAPSTEIILFAHDLAFRDRLTEWPFRSFVLLLQQARRDRYAAESGQSVMALGTATEVLVEAVVAAALRADGREEDRITTTLDAGFRNLIRDHLVPLLKRLGGDSELPGRWLDDCYPLRNRVAHEGYVPTQAELTQAMDATLDLAGEIAETLRASPTLADVGDQLPISRRTT
jgi:hypothetical protein